MTRSADSETLPPETHLGRTALRVSDLEETTAFYRDVVGFDVLTRTERTATLGADAPVLVLEADEDAPERGRAETGLYHNAFRVPSRGALGDVLRRVRERWHLDGASDHWVSEALYFSDPEGNGVEVYRDRPREEWPVADDGTVQMGTEPMDAEGVAAAADGDDSAPAGTDLGHVHLEVSSLDAFEDFYVDTLGFESQVSFSGARFVSAGGYHHHVGANTWHGRSEPGDGRGLSWFEIVVPDSAALEAAATRLADGGHPPIESEEGVVVTDSDDVEIRIRTP